MEQITSFSSIFEKLSDQIGIHLQADQVKQFMVYLEQLQIWNRSVNLTSITESEEIIVKHFVDSLAGMTAEPIAQGTSLVDIGTGAGFPGIPLKITRNDLNITLIEPVQKKISFLYSIVGLLRLKDVTIFYGTLDQFIIKNSQGSQFDYMTTRALKYESVLRRGSKLLMPGGKAIIYSSSRINPLELGNRWSINKEREFDLPMGFGHRVVSILSPA
ncbi:MAG: 16S rRNA (guanine(527)-N(7))-methyltransferase RsmG [Nitrospira sp.]|nr:16S rRNA (guanine(527)-N(7))-methyltransferase RsmG [Nitrospira sp.]MBH0195187.1 16S rRNA (guanine(527)-N(7))-methyltransferase RsmG [Nitrospira sp.]